MATSVALLNCCDCTVKVSRVKRDLERVESERERAREDAKRCGPLVQIL